MAEQSEINSENTGRIFGLILTMRNIIIIEVLYGELGGSAIGRSWPNLSFSPFTIHLSRRNCMSSSKDLQYGASRLQRVPTSFSLKSLRGQTPPVRRFH